MFIFSSLYIVWSEKEKYYESKTRISLAFITTVCYKSIYSVVTVAGLKVVLWWCLFVFSKD